MVWWCTGHVCRTVCLDAGHDWGNVLCAGRCTGHVCRGNVLEAGNAWNITMFGGAPAVCLAAVRGRRCRQLVQHRCMIQQYCYNLTHLRQVQVHLVAVKVRVEGRAAALVEAQRAPRAHHRAEGLDGDPMQAGLAVEQHQVAIRQVALHHIPHLSVWAGRRRVDWSTPWSNKGKRAGQCAHQVAVRRVALHHIPHQWQSLLLLLLLPVRQAAAGSGKTTGRGISGQRLVKQRAAPAHAVTSFPPPSPPPPLQPSP